MCITGLFARLMKMNGILIKQIERGEILSAAEPLIYDVPIFVVHLKIAPVGMHGGNHWIFGMNHQTEAASKKIHVFHTKVILHAFGQWTVYLGNVDTAFFKNSTVFNHPSSAPSSFFTLPKILLKFGHAVQFFQFGGDGIL